MHPRSRPARACVTAWSASVCSRPARPLSAEEAHLRRRLLPALVRRVEHNWANHNRDVRLFEVGTVFRRGSESPVEEWSSVAAVLTGARRPPHWSEGAKLPDMDIWDLKYHFELAVELAAPGCNVEPATGGAVGWCWVGLAPSTRMPRCGRLRCSGSKSAWR